MVHILKVHMYLINECFIDCKVFIVEKWKRNKYEGKKESEKRKIV